MDLREKRVVVTGAASGIGAALLKELSNYRCSIVAADKDSSGLESSINAVTSAPGSISAFAGDLSFQRTVDDLFEFAVARMGGIDIFFANAGFGYYESIGHADWKHIEDIFRLNVFSVIYAAEKMRDINPDGKYRVVITSSTAGRVAMEGYALYGSTKAALDRFAEGYRMEISRKNALVMVYPVAVRTGFLRTAGDAPLAWPNQGPDRTATAIIKGLIKEKKDIYSSSLLVAMMAIGHYLPFTRRPYQTMESRRFRKWLDTKERGE